MSDLIDRNPFPEAKILVLDDQPLSVGMMQDGLRSGGYHELRGTTSAREAIALFSTFSPDLVLLDLVMPEMSGFEVMRKLRALCAPGDFRPILVITSDLTIESRRTALASGATDFLLKPFDRDELLLRVANLLETRQLHRRLTEQNRRLTAEIAERHEAEKALRHEHAELTDFFENAPMCLHWVGADGTILWANRAELELGGYTAEEYIGRKITEFHADEHVIGDILHRLTNRETLDHYPARLRCKEGNIKHVLINSNVLWREGEFVHTRCFTRDVTARYLAEEALRESSHEKERLAAAVHHSSAAVVISDPHLPDNPLIFVNPAFTAITGHEPADVLGRNCRFLQGAETDKAVVAGMREAIDARRSFHGVLLNYRKDGSTFWNQLTVTPVFDEHGALMNFVGMQVDVTEQHRAREAQRQSEERLRALVESLDEIVFEFDAEGTYLNVSTSDEALLARPVAELLGRRVGEVLGDDAARPFVELFKRVIAERRPETLTYELPLGTGPRCFLARITPVLASDGSCRTVCMLSRDITERKAMEDELRAAKERAERADLAKSEFLSRMSHELRTPLNAILGFGQLLEMASLGGTAAGNAEQIVKAGRHLLNLINEVLQLSGIESGQLNFSTEPAHAGDVIREACALIRPLADVRGIAVRVEQPCGDCHVQADRQRLMQVLLNLLGNAVKYHHEGGDVDVRCEAVATGGWRITVADNGPGIAPEHLEAIFAPFERIGAEQRGIEGTGLGLALSKRLIEAMDGRVGVESEVGRGSRFWVELGPAECPVERPAATAPTRPAGARHSAGTVLYIEDNLSNLRLIEHLFAKLPAVELISAMQGRLGLELARKHRPDLILLDLHLPDMRGDAVLRELRADAATKDIPVVILSADATPRQIERLLAAGASEYLTKPLDVRAFLKTTEALLRRAPSPG